MSTFTIMFIGFAVFFVAVFAFVVTNILRTAFSAKKGDGRSFARGTSFNMANELHHQAHENAMRMHEQAHNMAVADHMRAVEHHNMVTNDLFVNNSIHDHMTAMDNHNRVERIIRTPF